MRAPKLSNHGFSLIEVMIATAISSVILLIGSEIYQQGLGAYYGIQQRSSLAQDALSLVDFLRNQLLAAGGGSTRSWMGIWVEDNCAARAGLPACSGSDRLTISTATYPLSECSITANASATSFTAGTPGACCTSTSWLNQNAIMVLNGAFINRYVTAYNTATCVATVTPGQAAGWDKPGTTVNWTGGTMTMVNVQTLYLDPTTNILMNFSDANNNGVVDSGEAVQVAVGIVDFQVALGYDFNPADGKVTASATGAGDEWMYNAAGEKAGAGAFAAASFSLASLLLVSPAVIMGTANGSNPKPGANTAQVLNGPTRVVPGWSLRTEITQLAPRNSYVFQ